MYLSCFIAVLHESDVAFHHLMVVEMVLDAFDDLVVLVTFAGYEDNISALCEGACRLDGRSTVMRTTRSSKASSTISTTTKW